MYLRHSFASIAVSGGDSLYLVGKVLGHRQSRTTERYAHLKDDPLRAVANRTSERTAAIMQGRKDTKVVPLPSSKSASLPPTAAPPDRRTASQDRGGFRADTTNLQPRSPCGAPRTWMWRR
jgi:hypothetical protein